MQFAAIVWETRLGDKFRCREKAMCGSDEERGPDLIVERTVELCPLSRKAEVQRLEFLEATATRDTAAAWVKPHATFQPRSLVAGAWC